MFGKEGCEGEVPEVVRPWGLTIESDVMVGEDDWTVAFGGATHGDVEHSVGRLDIMLLRLRGRQRKNTEREKLSLV